jgi:hypothetical protein
MIYYDTPSDTLQDTDTVSHANARNDAERTSVWWNDCVAIDGTMSEKHEYAITHGTPCDDCEYWLR